MPVSASTTWPAWGEVRAGQVRAGQGRPGQGRAGQVRAGQVRAGEVRAGEVRAADTQFLHLDHDAPPLGPLAATVSGP